MSNKMKDLRNQLKQIVKEVLPDLLNEALKDALFKKLEDQLKDRLDPIEKNVKETMTEMNNRSKDVQSYLVRQISTSYTPKAE